MKQTRNKITLLLSACCFMLLAGCTVSESVQYDETANFREFQTFGFYQENPAAEQDIAAGSYNTLLDQYLKSAIRQTLTAQEGLTYDPVNPDLKVAYDVSVDTEVNVNTNYAFAPGFGYGYSYWYGYRYDYGFNNFPTAYRTVNQYREGTVIIDLVNTDTNELVWRGVGEAVIDFEGNISQETINQIVSEVLEEYPPRDN